ncbi:integrin alpha-PS4-like [Drosophila eugracilis]|uniref:integrin alpha-PS4-like n=1 Tax=Drosophila eugracilis TaxID=29029 RepID=UPI001BD9DAEC|nr:integrin alpha-PS4-like [Drosophila eugracilis]
MYRLLLLIILGVLFQIEAFNIAPYPNLTTKYQGQENQTRSSYFGYSLVIRENTIIVGAPRANSTLEKQHDIIEPGVIFSCSLKNGTCQQYEIDSEGNDLKTSPDESSLGSKVKHYQWMGGSMDGGVRDNDSLLVCAPRFYSLKSMSKDEFKKNSMIGVCYLIKESGTDKLWPLKDVKKQTIVKQIDSKNETFAYYEMGELGFSSHVSDDNSKAVMGAVGVDDWKGMVFLFQQGQHSFDTGLVRRDTSRALRRSKREESCSHCLPQPKNWGQDEHSYFGYAVSSGYFDSSRPHELLYVATAPHAKNKTGEASIFHILGNGENITIFQTLKGKQFGEYFGYSILAEDINGDKKTDIIISAPMYATNDLYDSGAIYVFINKGSFNFERTIIESPAGSNGRFGTALSRLGDINHDGYNDVAVGAPFDGNGSVFIYLGCKNGLQNQSSQRLENPSQQPSKYGAHMFGHSFSRGSDIDGNGFNDFAVGAPNAESVYVYRTYPVVKIYARIVPESNRIKPGQKNFTITACYSLYTTSKSSKVQNQELDILIDIDTKVKTKRIKFAHTDTCQKRLTVNASTDKDCKPFTLEMIKKERSDFTPIALEIHYELKKKIPKTEEFCIDCAIVNPEDVSFYMENITFSAGCANDVCEPDLKLSSKNMRSQFTLGSTNVLRLSYDITNDGENAYEPQFNVSTSPRLPFAQVPGNCKVTEHVMVCDLKQRLRLVKGDTDSVTVSFDVSQLSGQSLTVHAASHSTGNEKNSADNKLTNVIILKELSDIEASGGQTNDNLVLRHYPYSGEVINHYEIKSQGPSIIEDLAVSLYIPVAYWANDSEKFIPILNISSLKMEANYDSHLLPIQLYDQNNLLLNSFTEIGQDNEKTALSVARRRRDVNSIQEPNANQSDVITNEFDLEENLPTNKTIVLNCQDTNNTICIRAEMRMKLMVDKPVNLNASFMVDLKDVDDAWEYLVIMTNLTFVKAEIGDSSLCSLVIHKKIGPNVITKHAELAIWKIILAVICGVLLLSAITSILYKNGFFKRTMKYELSKLIRDSFEEGLVEAEKMEYAKTDEEMLSDSDEDSMEESYMAANNINYDGVSTEEY